jgi:hypothetical protein
MKLPVPKPPALLLLLLAVTGLNAADAIFSGPQPGEKTTPFRVLEIGRSNDGKERDPITEGAGAPTALVFLHTVERSLVPLLRVVDQYGAERKDRLKTEIIFLHQDRREGEQRAKAVSRSLQLQSPVSLSLDGAEGPGNYGLNKECMMTIVAAKNNKVTANFALVQPGIADAPKVIAALALTCGDDSPPPIEQLSAQQMARSGGRDRPGRMQREGSDMEGRRPEPVDFSKLDLTSETGLREAVATLITEVRNLRKEVNELRRRGVPPAKDEIAPAKTKEDYPGAMPADPRLNSLLRQFIRPTNDDAKVDELLVEIRSHIKDNADLTQQAIDGWTRILHFGDRYGTAYARKRGGEFLETLKQGRPKSNDE